MHKPSLITSEGTSSTNLEESAERIKFYLKHWQLFESIITCKKKMVDGRLAQLRKEADCGPSIFVIAGALTCMGSAGRIYRRLVVRLVRQHRGIPKAQGDPEKPFFDNSQVWLFGSWPGGMGRQWNMRLMKRIARQYVHFIVVQHPVFPVCSCCISLVPSDSGLQFREQYTSKMCYYCMWDKEGWRSDGNWAELKAPDKLPKGRMDVSRYKHDHRQCSQGESVEGHPNTIYRDGGAAINILELASYTAMKAQQQYSSDACLHFHDDSRASLIRAIGIRIL